MTAESSGDVAGQAADVLAPETSLFEDADLAELGRSLAVAAWRTAAHPVASLDAYVRCTAKLATLPAVALARWTGGDVEEPVALDPKDRRFADPAWRDNPALHALRLAYLASGELGRDLLDAADLDAGTAAKARLAFDLAHDALAPTNFLATNPAALKRGFDTGGASLVAGARTFVDDLLHRGGRPRQVDTTPFELGVNLAATPGQVVWRNELMELIQYAPQTDQVHERPLLCSPPWINKYYVMDLAPDRSFIEWAVRHGHTVFAISYRNPPAEMSSVTMDDYLVRGPHEALNVVQEITGADTIDIVGLCLGGALTAIAAAWLIEAGDDRIGNLTLLNTLLDYSKPGGLGVFTDERTVERLERRMAREGQLAGESMAGTFDLLRANDLIFNYVVNNWLMGQPPPAFDILAWNADSTRMPATMHSFYLRHFYLQNELARGELELGGKLIDLGLVAEETYVVGAENDHIVLWEAAYQAVRLLGGPVRFVLSSGGHIAGIVNPPGPKGWHLVADGDGVARAETAEEWRATAVEQAGSWWEDWARWSSEHAGALVDPPPMGSEQHPPLYAAPGEYIRG